MSAYINYLDQLLSKSELHFSIKIQVKYSQWLTSGKIICLMESAKELSDK